MRASDAALELAEGSIPLDLEIAATAAGAASLVQHLGAGDLGEPRNLVKAVAPRELDAHGGGGPAEGGPHREEPVDAGSAVGVGEVPAALEEPEQRLAGGRHRRRRRWSCKTWKRWPEQ